MSFVLELYHCIQKRMLEKGTVCLSEAVDIQCKVTLTVPNGAGRTTIATSRGFPKELGYFQALSDSPRSCDCVEQRISLSSITTNTKASYYFSFLLHVDYQYIFTELLGDNFQYLTMLCEKHVFIPTRDFFRSTSLKS